MAIAGAGGWIPAATIKLDYAGRVHRIGTTVNRPKDNVTTDIALALASLWLGETVTVDARVILGAIVHIIDSAADAAGEYAALTRQEMTL